MRATSPDGASERVVRIDGFAVFGGKPSDRRLARTGRIDVHVIDDQPDEHPVSLRWQLSGPLDG